MIQSELKLRDVLPDNGFGLASNQMPWSTVWLFRCLIKHNIRTAGTVEVYTPSFFFNPETCGQLHTPVALPPRSRYVASRITQDAVQKTLCHCRELKTDHCSLRRLRPPPSPTKNALGHFRENQPYHSTVTETNKYLSCRLFFNRCAIKNRGTRVTNHQGRTKFWHVPTPLVKNTQCLWPPP